MQITLSMKPKPEVAVAANKLEHIPYTGTSGLYSAVVPRPDLVAKIMALANELALPTDEEALHSTVIYSKKAPPRSSNVANSVNEDREYNGLLNAIDSWVGHNGKTYIVAKIVSEALSSLNATFNRLGAEHTFVPYAPHITLSDEVPVDDAMKARIEKINKRLASNPIELVFNGLILGDLEP